MVELRLGAQLTAKVLGRIGGRATDRFGHLGHVHDDRFDAVPFALHFGRDAGHLVPIENVGDITVDVDGTHFVVVNTIWMRWWAFSRRRNQMRKRWLTASSWLSIGVCCVLYIAWRSCGRRPGERP